MKDISKILFLLIIIIVNVLSQENGSETSLDMLRAPSSPAFQILEVSSEDIERPNTPTDFWASIKEATNSYGLIPKNYSIDIAPYWLFGGQNISFDKFKKGGEPKYIGRNILQTLGVSFGTTTKQDSVTNFEYRRVALGLKFSLLQGKIDPEFEKKEDELLEKALLVWSDSLSKYKDTDSIYRELMKQKVEILKKEDVSEIKKINDKLDEREKVLQKKFEDELASDVRRNDDVKKIKEELENNKLKRLGWVWDLAGAFGLDFPQNDMKTGQLSKFGCWTTLGYEHTQFSGLLLGRAMWTPRQIKSASDSSLATLLNLDYGAKIFFDGIKNFTFSFEMLGRSVMKEDSTENKNKYTFNLSYEVSSNKLLTLSFGKEFDKKPEFGGNLIVALNLVLGFGSSRSFELPNY